ncbi:MAG TPA: hypothetical protein ENJ00_08705 [Phycisphaerales bacterium]|nr:hypothetical protein [Phycisphaerales bacterium]
MTNRKCIGAMLILCGAAATAIADPPPGYYNSATATDGPTLQAQLSAIINQALVRSYGEARTLLQNIDEDPNNFTNIILVYNGASVLSTWDQGTTWNREHTWPKSLGVGSDGADYSDLHQLHPCNPSINGLRGNKQFGTAPGQWDPNQYGKIYRGRMARMAFYMKTRYSYLNIAQLGSQQQFVDWHFDEMPSAIEGVRNDRVYDVQSNRNPFTDHPEWVWAIFGTGPSDAQITLAGQSNTNGSSSQTIDLGAVIADANLLTTTIMLDKTGAAPTTYSLTAAGDAADPGSLQFGLARNAQSAVHTVGLTGTGFGPFSGTITVDNTEITSAAAGLGADDGDDVITLTGAVLDHTVPSLDAGSVVDSITIDFGTIDLGSAAAPIASSVWNVGIPGIAAGLDVDAVTLSGDASAFTTDLVPTSGILPGSSMTFDTSPTASSLGTFLATMTIGVSDEDLPGAVAVSPLTISLQVTVVAPCPPDVNHDGMVTSADFSAWLAAFNAGDPECDQNADGSCTAADFTAWVANFNTGC